MKFLTKKQIFEKVKRHLLKQRRQAFVGSCVYKTGDGLKCAVGCLIDDQHYSAAIEGSGVNWLSMYLKCGDTAMLNDGHYLLTQTLLESGVDVSDIDVLEMLTALQDVHDKGEPCDWKKELYGVAIDHGLL